MAKQSASCTYILKELVHGAGQGSGVWVIGVVQCYLALGMAMTGEEGGRWTVHWEHARGRT